MIIEIDHRANRPATLGAASEPAVVERGQVRPPAQPANDPFEPEPQLYAPRKEIYPQGVKGRYRTIKWILLCVALGIYYLLPFVRWDRGPAAPDQAVLADLANGRFYFFFVEIWPQEVYYLTGLLIIAAMTLFLMNAVAGRVWCGYMCPQTVWTDLFMAVERLFEGDRRERMQRDASRWTAQTVARKAMKHFAWLMIAWWTGGAWVLYFADAPTLVKSLATGDAPFIAYAWIGILTFTTYVLAGHMREQVCLYMCPWPRIQAALTDEHALNVSYRYDRGEPRASVKKSAVLRQQGEPAGDCIDCMQCVYVCPTGIDIRDGLQVDCIQCGLCIDACNAVMTKVNRPTGLIGYDTDINIQRRAEGKPAARFSVVRSRTLLYAGIIALVSAIMLATFLTRGTMGINVLHDRNPVFVTLSDGAIRNGYTLRVLNKALEERTFILTVEGILGTVVDVVGGLHDPEGRISITVGPDQTRELRALVTAHQALPETSLPLLFRIYDLKSGEYARASDHFRGP